MQVGHEGLMTLARKVHAAASDKDAVRLEQAARHLLDALRTHIEDEAVAMIHLSPPDARTLVQGQARLSAAVEALIADAARGCSGPPRRCVNRAEELLAFLVLQARDEHLAGCDRAA
ncbi:MAG: hypothetical protein ACRDV4_12080 [Acidimicrobiales bacterium]